MCYKQNCGCQQEQFISKSCCEKKVKEAYCQGYRNGYEKGYRCGFEKGQRCCPRRNCGCGCGGYGLGFGGFFF